MAERVKKKGISFNPEGYVEGGGLIDNIDATWKEVGFKMFDYNGTAPESSTLAVAMEVDGQEEEYVEHYSMGKAEIDEETNRIVDGALTKTCKMALLIKSLIEAEFPAEKIQDDPTVFEGLKAHMVRIDAPERKGLVRKVRTDGKEYKETVLVVDKILKLPWEKKERAGGEKGAMAPGEGDGLNEQATALVMELLEKYPKGVERKKLAGEAFQKLKMDKDPNRNAITQLINTVEFISEGPWKWDEKKGIVGG